VLARSRNPRKRRDALLADPQAAALVPRIPIEELYYLVRGVGLADAVDVLRLASPEQLQGCLDLDLWTRDRIATSRVFTWLEVLAELPPAVLARTVRSLDAELVALVVGKHARVYDRTVGEAPPDESRLVVHRTPDAAYVIEFRTPDATTARTLERFLVSLYDGDPDLARALLTETRWGTLAELEEESYRWRTARLADLGFPSWDEAAGVYREVPAPVAAPRPLTAPAEPTTLPAPFADALGDDSLLARALAVLDDPAALDAVSSALIALANRVLVADRVDPADVDAVRETTARVRDTLSLALDHLAGGDVAAAALLLGRTPLADLFATGYALTTALARRARALERAGVIEPVLDPLLAPRPLFPRSLDAEPTAGERPFRAVADLRAAEAALARLESGAP
jgi:hypothetical protein